MKVLVVGLLSVATATFGATPGIDEAGVLRQVLSCPLADGSRIALEARSHGLDGDALFVRRVHKTGRAFLDMPETDFVGRIALSRCVGRTLVFVLNYGTTAGMLCIRLRTPENPGEINETRSDE
ncbi:hypothetical protein [Burkholderia cepacia]|uniref:hypothetical protein n=1 Tax=Burkholderia cepacia TaxID=292 RepID=UPI00158BE479|nr:hypothetical protein [Burkholderia cepacia]